MRNQGSHLSPFGIVGNRHLHGLSDGLIWPKDGFASTA
jgi:hypothetical protein